MGLFFQQRLSPVCSFSEKSDRNSPCLKETLLPSWRPLFPPFPPPCSLVHISLPPSTRATLPSHFSSRIPPLLMLGGRLPQICGKSRRLPVFRILANRCGKIKKFLNGFIQTLSKEQPSKNLIVLLI